MKSLIAASTLLFLVAITLFASNSYSDETATTDTPAAKEVANEQPATPAEATAEKADTAETDAEKTDAEAKESDKVVRTDREWRKLLTREEYRVLREKGTERPYVNKYDHHFKPGYYMCAGCGQVLFESDTKFDSGCGWPAFYAAKAEDRVVRTPDFSLGMNRVEVTCARCGSHLGHVFQDGYNVPTGERFCINSVSLKFISKRAAEAKAKREAEQQAKEAKAAAAKQQESSQAETPVDSDEPSEESPAPAAEAPQAADE
ncbi:peptide-methionine (R)-S-oxide reductase MsrB [Aeoliella mucimassa]|uniref:peptide-methionine (R)-S-oxide reductase n=1 Tax=Aeoliella mucimassa TaxID=2527972 RepID=A0A518AVV6_9BACT|nr:peptide-methionine (R)-S-oxide reductase MsrB [Aeoliella mucimassa]QDU58860.1 Peptide methionine sulfoxide reductase MsrB [Aeoliella mucimassa]